jgi:threonine aldolase
VDDFAKMLLPENIHFPRTRLVCLENTHNRGGGRVYPKGNIDRICAWAHENGLATHLDGARLMNAVVATGIPADVYVAGFDTVSICFSKGLGAPVGSALAGSKELIHEARRTRKLLGGGMRQAGILAAACLYALDHHVERLAEDHANAQILAEALEETKGFEIKAADVETNLLWVPIDPSLGTAQYVVDRFAAEGFRILAIGPQLIRICTHLGVTTEDCRRAAEMIRRFARA